jgi:hypothetical protein
MKKIFIGLLIIAAGAGGYYFLQNKKAGTTDIIEKELLVGKWKMDSLYTAFKDSIFRKYQYDFQKGGAFLQTLNDSVKADTSYYKWDKKNELLIKQSVKDSTGELYSVNKLSIDSLVLQSKDSVVFVLTKLK